MIGSEPLPNGPDFLEPDTNDHGDVGFQFTIDPIPSSNSPVKMPPVYKGSQEPAVAMEVTDPVVSKDADEISDGSHMDFAEQNGMEIEEKPNPEPQVESPPKAKPSSWAGLFKNSQQPNVPPVPTVKSNNASFPFTSVKDSTPSRESKADSNDTEPSPVLAADDKASMELAGMSPTV